MQAKEPAKTPVEEGENDWFFDIIINFRYDLLEFYDDNTGVRRRVGYETGPVVLAVVTYRKSQTVDLMEPIITGLPDYKDLGHGVQ